MKRLLSAVLAAVALAVVAAGSGDAQTPSRPNVLLIQVDDMESDDLKALPSVRALAAQGTTFANSFVGYSLCCPSRSTLLTGQYNHNNNVLGNPPEGGYDKLDHTNTLPVWLQQAGYHTTHIGKYLNGYGSQVPAETVPPGYSDWQGLVDPSTYRMYGYRINDDGTLVNYQNTPADYQTDVLADRAVAALQQRVASDQPFYLNLSPLAPHGSGAVNGHDGNGPDPAPRHKGAYATEPLDTDPSYNEADVTDKPASIQSLPQITPAQRAAIDTRNRRRLESLLSVDEAIARMIAVLRASGKLDETVVIFTSDNGWQEGEHRVQSGKVRVYEPSIRVPLIVRGPGFAAGAVAQAIAINTDLAPTIAGIAGATPGRTLDGLPLTEVAAGGERASARPLLYETGKPGVSTGNFVQAVRTRDEKYAEYANGEREYYDLRSDPYELSNRFNDPAAAAPIARLAELLSVLKTCAGDACRRPADAIPTATPSSSPVPTATPTAEPTATPTPTTTAIPPLPPGTDRAVTFKAWRVELGREHRLRLPLRCSAASEEGCRGTLRIEADRLDRRPGQSRRKVIARGGFFVGAGQTRRVAVRVGRDGRRRLARERRPTVYVRATYESLAGGPLTAEGRYRLTATRQGRRDRNA